MSDTDLCYIPAHEALKRFRDRSLSPVELMRAVIARAEAVEPGLIAFTHRRFDEAMDKARAAEAHYAAGRPRPLEGLPLAVKDEQEIKGQPSTSGSLLYRDNIAQSTSPSIARLLRAGAIVHARTVTPEFCCVGVTHSRLWGVSRNPWNRDYDVGGSSGGSASALAAGMTTLANGTDYAGSIRIPASCCGVVGYKPPYGRNPELPPFNLDPYNHIGPMARSVADCALMQNVMCGPHAADHATVRPKLRIPAALGDIKGWRIGWSMDLGYFAIDAAVRANTLAALDAFRAAGAEVVEVALPWTLDVRTAFQNHLEMIFGAWIGQALDRHRDLLTDYARTVGERARAASPARLMASMEVEGQMAIDFDQALRGCDVLVCPTLAIPAMTAGFGCFDPDFEVDGVKVDSYLQWCLTYPFNMLNRCPVLSLPSGVAPSGVPTGIQIVGRPFDDVRAFRAAAAFERAMPWAGRRPSL